jgi:hypothetical protein
MDAASSQKCREKNRTSWAITRRGADPSPRPRGIPGVAEQPDHGPGEREVVHHVAADRGVLGRPERPGVPVSAAVATAPMVLPRMPPVPNSSSR